MPVAVSTALAVLLSRRRR
ncbi:hypothetical protein G7068_10990 [Leucobacter viscericola]|uniref:Uncharacterized protein n=1 Tax=Leucobacter viscericola TaxID=2714935 RepID=A0A6G7XK85_9MICO|nr:hypothetical protein G7068_10990 [Leucobacter viscericola]